MIEDSSSENDNNETQNNNKNTNVNNNDTNTNFQSKNNNNINSKKNLNSQDDKSEILDDNQCDMNLNEREADEKIKEDRKIIGSQDQEILLIDKEKNINNNLKQLKDLKGDSRDVKLGSKIICPEEDCILEPIIFLESNYFEINYDCGKHRNKMDIIKFVESSSQKEELIKCSLCSKQYKTIKEKRENFYICLCGQTICQTCWAKHLSNKKKEEHIMTDYDKKNYICFCSKYLKKFIGYCLKCNKNFCILCKNEHKKHHNKDFTSLYKLGEIQKKNFGEKIKEQKILIEKFITIVDRWMNSTKIFLDNYKKKLQLYWEINNNIFNNYSVTNNFYNEIKNIENIRFDFEENFMNLIKAENDLRQQNQIIIKILNENIKNKEENSIKKEKTPKLKKIGVKNDLNGSINHICELKKEELLILNISDKNKQELHVYKIDKKDKENFEPHIISVVEDGEIKSLSELKNGHLLMVQKKCFKIIGITSTKTEINIIQKEKLSNINQIIELINGNLVSNSLINNNNYCVYIWEKNQISDSYESKKENLLEESPHMAISLLEINKDTFVILNKEGSNIDQKSYLYLDIFRFNLKESIEEKIEKEKESKSHSISHCVRFKIQSKFIKMLKYDEENIICLYEKGTNTINLISEQYSNLYDIRINNENIEPNIITTILFDICKVPNSKKFFLVSFKETTKKDIIFGVKLLKFDLFSHEIKAISRYDLNACIVCLLPLSNDAILMGSDEKSLFIYE